MEGLMSPFFEENPWLLVPLVVIIVEAWNAAKAVVRSMMKSRSLDILRCVGPLSITLLRDLAREVVRAGHGLGDAAGRPLGCHRCLSLVETGRGSGSSSWSGPRPWPHSRPRR